MNTCYYCGKEIPDKEELFMKDINIGLLKLEHKTFHRECWETYKRKEKMRTIKTLCAVAIICIAIILYFLLSVLYRV